ncbi:hypothetical protein HLB44_36540 [Aquincola sp. S2]|uniref:HEAT repeat domain-containing protein n=1 Tax=Pseudaquabacterium terrae TaxID=2732868 RepID=A0ABX2EV54_9BURK|nr:hypothetical protein [Aquabacterium terrae]NRF72473.1 hypothetical protein [Aquabacterium terrae]
MTHTEALSFLSLHQPMPGDSEISPETADRFIETLRFLEENPHPAAVPFLIGSVSEHTGLGMYEHIGFVLRKLPPYEVAPHLIQALKHGEATTRARAAWWAADCPCPALAKPIRDLLAVEQDPQVRYAAESALQVCLPNAP